MDLAKRRLVFQGFQEEAEEHLSRLAAGLLELENDAQKPGLLPGLLRSVHSLKGAAKMVEAVQIERTAHAVESVLSEVRSGRLEPGSSVIDALLEAGDSMNACLTDEAAGLPPRDSAQVVSRLLGIVSSGAGREDELAGLFPSLDPEIREVLTEFQKAQLLQARQAGKTCWELELEVPEADFGVRVDAVRKELKGLGEAVSVAGLTPKADGRLRLKFLIATRLSPEKVREFGVRSALVLHDPAAPKAAPAGGPSAALEEEFAQELVKLRAQFVSEKIDEMAELAKLVLALEEKPDDEEVVNTLFRHAHSLKGAGATYRMPSVSVVSHFMESILDRLRKRALKPGPQVADALLKGVDTLKELFVEAREDRLAEDRPLPVVKVLEAVLEDGGRAAEAPQQSAGELKMEFKESIRVKLDKLDRLVNLSSELTVNKNTREAALKELEVRAEDAKGLARKWRKLREDLQVSGALFTGLRQSGLLEAFDGLGERLAGLQEGLETLWNGFGASSLHAAATVDALQHDFMRIRMVPISLLLDGAPRLIRDLTRDGVKQARLVVSGGQTELDKKFLEQLADPLMHLLRNAVDHGLETVAERRRLGKPEAGTITLSAEQRGRQVVLTIKDDGHGMDPKVLSAKAVERGLIAAGEAQKLSPEQTYAFIFLPGFSTKEHVTTVSGRGVGMDVVKHNIDGLKGQIEITSLLGQGTTFTIRLPLSIAVIQAVLIEASGRTFCLPTDSIAEIVQVARDEIQTEDGRPCLAHRGRTIPVVRLSDLLRLPERPTAERFPVVVTSGLEGTVGLVIDRVMMEETVVLKEMGGLLRRVPHVAGGTLLADGRVAVILDARSLVAAAVRGASGWAPAAPDARAAVRRKKVLVVDDSLTTRELLRGLLETAGYEVTTFCDGQDAWAGLEKAEADLVVSDVQMPRMDGYALASAIKASPKLSKTPVILVTALSKEDERLKGMQAGADAYIVKGAFDQAGLLARVGELLGGDGG